ncbi:MAG: glycosyl hydrolase 115 family protein [Bacteroidales bacterium]|nr:glycosyl hydrolase 115 family protein [Bacteroidales bacterium]
MKHTILKTILAVSAAFFALSASAIDHPKATLPTISADRFTLVQDGTPVTIIVNKSEDTAILRAANDLVKDFGRVTGNLPALVESATADRTIIIGSLDSPLINAMVSRGKFDVSSLQGCREKYLIQTVTAPVDGIGEALVIAGSDRRGVVYGIYEISEQIGVSPWYDWADVPVARQENLSIARGSYTAGEPAVRYRGIFLNDEAPCLTGWVKHTYGTDYGDHRFYERVFELILRLRGNFLWPAMWSWSFYADDPLNGKVADEMGVIMGTSHHEPMARNHQEWARKRNEYGAWDYETNQKVIDKFFREGIERAKDTEDLITIGMRGDGDTAMGGKEGHDDEFVPDYAYMIKMMQKIFNNQRKIIRNVTGRPASERPQVWALYKEVQTLYEKGLRVPDDVTILLSDDNWGDVRKLPNAEERKHPGGWGMYYHVDYVGAPRNSKWLNITPVQNLWEQMQLTYEYGVDRLWVLNVGDLKPMEYPITLFLDLAWNPTKYTAENIKDHTLGFCCQQFGEDQAAEAARILNLYSKYAGRITAEMLDRTTYNLQSGEWKQVSDEFIKLEAEALRQYMTLPEETRDAYFQIILFPIQALANVYEMYYAQAMNHHLYKTNDPAANWWADKVEACFARDKFLTNQYNNEMADGKWKNMMIQKHIGYRSWNDNFPEDTLPMVFRIDEDETLPAGFTFSADKGCVVIEAPHIYAKQNSAEGEWTLIEDMGRTLGGVALMPYDVPVEGAKLTYRMEIPADVKNVTVHVATKSTLAFHDAEGHSYRVGFKGAPSVDRCFNSKLNEDPANVYSIYYPTVSRRVAVEKIDLQLPEGGNVYELEIQPLDPGIVFEKIIVDFGGYQESYLLGKESSYQRK